LFFRAGRIRPHNANLTFGDLRIYFEAQPASEVDVPTLGAPIPLLDFGRTRRAVDPETARQQVKIDNCPIRANPQTTKPSRRNAIVGLEILLGAISLAILLLTTLMSLRDWREYQEATREGTHTRLVVEAADSLLSAVKDAETGQRGFILTGD